MDGNSTQNFIIVDPNSILQSDVAIIAGLLVLLTISGVLKEHFSIGQQEQVWKFLRWLIASTITLFSFSTVALLVGYGDDVTRTAILTFSRWLFVGGIVAIVGSIIVLMWYLKLKN